MRRAFPGAALLAAAVAVASFSCSDAGAPRGLAPDVRQIARVVREGQNPQPVDLALTLSGGCDVTYDVASVTTDGARWITFPLGATGAIAVGQTVQVRVGFEVVATNLVSGTYVGSVVVNARCANGRPARGSPLVVPVSMNVLPGERPDAGACPAKGSESREYEPVGSGPCNDTIGTADHYDPAMISSLTGVLDRAGDVDVYRYDVTVAPSLHVFWVAAGAEVPAGDRPRPVFDVLRDDGSLHTSSPRGPEIDESGSGRQVFFAETGSYYVRVSNSGGGASGPMSAYMLSLYGADLIDAPNPVGFPIDRPDAIFLPSGVGGFTSDVPRFRVFLEAGSTFSVHVTAAGLPTPSSTDFRLYVYDIEDTLSPIFVASNDDGAAGSVDPVVEFTTPKQTHYLFVLDWRGPAGPGQPFRFQIDCPAGYQPYLPPGTQIYYPICLKTPVRDTTCAPPVPDACSARPNLLANGGSETAPANPEFFPRAPAGWEQAPGIGVPTSLDSGCFAPAEPDCFFIAPNFWTEGAGAYEGRRFLAFNQGLAMAQSLATPLTAGHVYHFSARVRQHPDPDNWPGKGSLYVSLGSSLDDVFERASATTLGHLCASGEAAEGWTYRSFTFTAPSDAAARTFFGVRAMVQSASYANINMGVDDLKLVDVTGCP